MTQLQPINHRPSFEEHALLLAFIAAKRSEDLYRKVGACGLDYNNRVLGVSYNGLIPKIKVPEQLLRDRDLRRKFFICAETNLLSLIKINECRLIAITCLPCVSCAKNIVAHGIKEVIYSDDYATEDNASMEIFDFYKIKVNRIKLNEE